MRVPTLFLILLTAFAATDIYASTLTVTKTDDTNDGVCDTDCSLREAVAAAASGDTVVFSSLFNSPQAINLTLGTITINSDLTITGPGRSLLSVNGVLGEHLLGRLFINPNASSINLRNMTFSGGCSGGLNDSGVSPYGGAIFGGRDLRLENMLFTGNRAYTRNLRGDYLQGYGGAIVAGNVVIINSEFSYNWSVQGGGAIYANNIDITDSQVVSNVGGDSLTADIVTVNNSTFTDNEQNVYYGIYGGAVGGTTVNVYNSTFTSNAHAVAGYGSLRIENSSIINGDGYSHSIVNGTNSVGIVKNTLIGGDRGWGGIGNKGTLYIVNSAFVNNNLGIESEGGNLFITNSTVSGNVCPWTGQDGAGIYSKPTYNGIGAHVVVTNSTIANNINSTRSGGGIYNSPNCTLRLRNSIVAGNTASGGPDIYGTVISEGNNLIGNTSGSSGWNSSDLVNENPMLSFLGNNGGPTVTHALQNGSPAIDAGNNSLAIDPQTQLPLTCDQRGFERFAGGTVDIGAYEAMATAPPVISGTITYGNAIGPPMPRFVSNVLIDGAGSPNVLITSISNGSYSLSGFGSGAYTVTPSKTGGVNGAITSFDSARVAQHVSGVNPLVGNQMIVADTSGNGAVSSFDAAQIARYAAGLNNFGSTSNWIFTPSNRTYPSVTTNIAGEDFIALLMGDVSGNWMPAGTSKSNLTEKR